MRLRAWNRASLEYGNQCVQSPAGLTKKYTIDSIVTSSQQALVIKQNWLAHKHNIMFLSG